MTPETLTIAAAAVRLYAESHPRPIHVTKTDAAKMLGISRPTVDTLNIHLGSVTVLRLRDRGHGELGGENMGSRSSKTSTHNVKQRMEKKEKALISQGFLRISTIVENLCKG